MTASALTASPTRDDGWPWSDDERSEESIRPLAAVAAGACGGVLLAAAGQQLWNPASSPLDLVAVLLATALAGLVVPRRLARGLAFSASVAAVLPTLLAQLAVAAALLPLPHPGTEIPGMRWPVALVVAAALCWVAALAPILVVRSVVESVALATAVVRGVAPLGLPLAQLARPRLHRPRLRRPRLPALHLPVLRLPSLHLPALHLPALQLPRRATARPRPAVSNQLGAPQAETAAVLDDLLARHRDGLTLVTATATDDPATTLAVAARRLRAWAPTGATLLVVDPATLALAMPHEADDDLSAKVRSLLTEPVATDEGPRALPLRIGSQQSRPHMDGATLLTAALTATPVLDADLREAAELGLALARNQLRVVFRPVLGLADRPEQDRVVSVEVLPRWHRGDGVLFSATELGAMAARAGLAAPMLRQVLEAGLDAITSWYEAGRTVGRLALTVPDGTDLTAVAEAVTDVLRRRRLPGSCLMLHLPPDADLSAARPLRLLDVQLMRVEVTQGPLDDVRPQDEGVAAVRLATRLAAPLRQFDPGTPEAAAGTEAVAGWHAAGVRVLVGGVTTVAELARLREHGVDAVHGALVGVPASARDLTAQLPSMHRPFGLRPAGPAADRPTERAGGRSAAG